MKMTSNNNSEINGQVLKLERQYYEQEQLNDELKYCKPKHSGKFNFNLKFLVCIYL